MEVSVVGCSQGGVVEACGRRRWGARRRLQQLCVGGQVGSRRWGKSSGAVSVRSVGIRAQVAVERVDKGLGQHLEMKKSSIPKQEEGVHLFVGLPLDSVSSCNTLNHAKAIAAGLKALKLLGVDGVELPFWWGIVEKEAQGKYDWSAYLDLAEMIRTAGLQLRASLCFHASPDHNIQLPKWVSKVGEDESDIYFTDWSGRRYKDCLSLSVDELPLFDGKTSLDVYREFMESFKSSFSDFMGSTITDVSVGLGPNGELRYPSFPSSANSQFSGVGEFQCYDKHLLDQLKQHAQSTGNQYWGLSGPHDTPAYDQSPDSTAFFRDNGGSWETPYGSFFLTWYSNQLLAHGDRVLSLASSAFGDSRVRISGKVPLMHSWFKTRSHASELTAGFHNTDKKDGYAAVCEMFARNSVALVVPGMDLSDKNLPQGSLSSPDALLSQIIEACKKQKVMFSGENSVASQGATGFSNIKARMLSVPVSTFTYQRMGAFFFSPEHFPKFTEFVRNLDQLESDAQDLPSQNAEGIRLPRSSEAGELVQMQAA